MSSLWTKERDSIIKLLFFKSLQFYSWDSIDGWWPLSSMHQKCDVLHLVSPFLERSCEEKFPLSPHFLGPPFLLHLSLPSMRHQKSTRWPKRSASLSNFPPFFLDCPKPANHHLDGFVKGKLIQFKFKVRRFFWATPVRGVRDKR